MDVVNLIVAMLGVGANVAIAYAAFRAIRESQRALKTQAEQFSTQYLQAQEEQRARVRPYLRPELVTGIDPKPNFDSNGYPFDLVNEGFGPAFNISAAIFPPGPTTSDGGGDPRRYAALRKTAVGAATTLRINPAPGVIALPGTTKLDPESPYMLYAPTAPPTSPAAPNQPTIPIHIPITARLTVTYQDADGLKHGAIFDFPDAPQMSWQLVTYLPGIAKTLDELTAEYDAKIYRQGIEQLSSPLRLPSRAE